MPGSLLYGHGRPIHRLAITLRGMELRECHHLIVFGGSFDPPHVAHMTLPMGVRQQVGADAVVYVPAGRAPHKLGRPQTTARHRLAMLNLALRDVDQALVLTEEVDRATDRRPSYTVETLEALRRRVVPGARVRLLIGADQLRIFDTWKSPDRILQLAEPLVMVRPPDTPALLLASLPSDEARAQWAQRLIDVPAMDVSSSVVRQRIRRGEPISNLVAPAVAQYIHEHGLYCRS